MDRLAHLIKKHHASKRPPKDPYAPKYHRDQTVTVWDVYYQQWTRTARPSDRILASHSEPERQRIIRHCRIDD